TRRAATSTRTGSPSAARRSSAIPTSASWTSSASAATTCCSSAPTGTLASSRWCSAARPSSCCGTAPARCPWRAQRRRRSRAEALGRLRELPHAAAGPLGHRADRLHAAIDGGGESLQRRLTVLDDLAQHAQRQEAALPPLLLEDDLREGDGGQVLPGVVLEDPHVLTGLHPAPDLVERHIAALARVVELAVAIALDESAHRSLSAITAPRARTTFAGNMH